MNNKNQLKTTGLLFTVPKKNNTHPALCNTLLISIFFYNYEITKKTVQRSNAPSKILPVLLLSIDKDDRFVIQKIIFFLLRKNSEGQFFPYRYRLWSVLPHRQSGSKDNVYARHLFVTDRPSRMPTLWPDVKKRFTPLLCPYDEQNNSFDNTSCWAFPSRESITTPQSERS